MVVGTTVLHLPISLPETTFSSLLLAISFFLPMNLGRAQSRQIWMAPDFSSGHDVTWHWVTVNEGHGVRWMASMVFE